MTPEILLMIYDCKSQLIKFIILLLLPCVGLKAQNLLINPGAEDGPPATNGWTLVSSGSNCYDGSGWRIPGNQNGFPAAHSGTYYFYPGCSLLGVLVGQTYELYQDVDVSANAAAIDLNGYGLSFSGYTRSSNKLFPDGATITVEARNSTNTTVLGSYSTGETKNRTGWTYYTATSLLPVGTRFIRVRLIATVHNLLSSVDSYFDDLSLKSLSVTSVNLTQFNAVKNRGRVFLNWQTVNELNNKGFTIMRSSDGSNWSDLGFIANNYQNTPDNNYSFEDQSPLDGRDFYKLRETGIDGKVKYSEILKVLMNRSSSLQVYPNPAHNILNIQISNEPRSLEIIDIYGKSIARYGNIKKIDISNLAKGVYILKVATVNKVITTKFVKR